MKIHEAAAQGNIDTILRELESGVPIDALNADGDTPLIVTVRSKESNVETIQLLLKKGANPNAIGGEYPSSVLLAAVNTGDVARVKCLLDAGADINFVDESGFDALMYVPTARFMSLDETLLPLVELLLERGASVSNVNEDGHTALMIAFDNGSFAIVKRLLKAGADETQLQWTPLMRAIAIGTSEEVREQIQQGANLSDREELGERTPWLLALSAGDIEKAKLLLEAGANINDIGWYQKTALMYPIEAHDPEMLKWLLSIGCDTEAAGEYGETALMKAAQKNSAPLVHILLEAGADPNKVARILGDTIEFTTSIKVAELLLAAGQDINKASTRTRALLFGIGYDDAVVVSREDCDVGAQPRFGTANPEKMDVPLWNAMARTGQSSEARRALFANYDTNLFWENCVGTYPFEKYPLWYYPRYGMSLIALPDRRFIEIGGYFEEGGNPNFCIYNEVFVRYPDQRLDIYGYPAEVFPPTDGHSATLVGEYIYIIGCIGYPEQRVVGYTPVYRLNTQTFAMEKIETTGDNPGWIFNHKAVLRGDEIHVSGGEPWKGPDTPEKIAENLAKMQKMVAFPKQEDYASTGEWLEATGQHLDENKFEQYQSTERFSLNLRSLQWRRLVD